MLPERDISSQTYGGIAIQCAMFYCPEVTRFRLKGCCPITESYYFEGVMRSTTSQTITVILGDKSEDIEITDTLQKYTKFFPDVNVSEDTDAYIVFPVGTYFLYNIQIEVATSPSAWRPAPEDAEDYATLVAQYAVDNQTQIDIFNKLTANGTAQGIYLVNGQLYISASYIQTGTLSADFVKGGELSGTTINIGNGTFTVDENGKVIAQNLQITGGSIDIVTEASSDPWKIVLKNTYNNVERTISILQTGIYVTQKDLTTNVTRAVNIAGNLGITFFKNDSGIKYIAVIEDSGGYGGREILYDNDGNERARFAISGITFKDANGNVTKTYPAT